MESNNLVVADVSREILTFDLPSPVALNKNPGMMLSMAKTMLIDSPEMAMEAANELRRVMTKWKELDEQRSSIVAPALQIQRNTNNLFRDALETLKQAETILKTALANYQRAEQARVEREKRALEETARIQREADEQAARIKQKEADDLAEQSRQAQRQAEEAQQRAEAASRQGNHQAAELAREEVAKLEQTNLTAIAMHAHADGEAQTLALEAVITVAAAPVAAVTKVAGVSSSKPWKARMTDKAAFLRYVADHPDLLYMVEVKMASLTSMAKEQKDALRIPGVEAFQDIVITARG